MGKLTEEDKLMRRIEKRFNKGVVQYGLIEDGDKILVGLSGGKDSLALLELLARRSRIYKPRFSVVAAHVVMTNIAYESDMDYLRSFAENLGVPFVRYEDFEGGYDNSIPQQRASVMENYQLVIDDMESALARLPRFEESRSDRNGSGERLS